MLAAERLGIALDALERTYEHVIMNFGSLPAIDDERLAGLAPTIVVVGHADALHGFEALAEPLRTAGCKEVLAFATGGESRISAVAPPASAAA